MEVLIPSRKFVNLRHEPASLLLAAVVVDIRNHACTYCSRSVFQPLDITQYADFYVDTILRLNNCKLFRYHILKIARAAISAVLMVYRPICLLQPERMSGLLLHYRPNFSLSLSVSLPCVCICA